MTVVLPSTAGAVLIRAHNGHIVGVLPIRGLKLASLPGRLTHRLTSASATPRSTSAARSFQRPADDGTVYYNGGPVLHATAPYLIFWDPHGEISSAQKTLFEQYFLDAAADSGASSNIFGVLRQYTDTSGFADYSQSFSTSHALTDTDAYPSASAQCTEAAAGLNENACLYDSQIQAEVRHVISAQGWPQGTSGTAPIYFVFTPADVNTCQSDDSTCADNAYCAYHGSFADGSSTVLYADLPMLLASQEPKRCQSDGTSAVQEPNANATDVVTSSMSHEFSETITDPVNGTGWWDSGPSPSTPGSGNEVGDNCAFTGSFAPADGDNPDAFSPALGGSAGAGTLYDQSINSDHYYTQTEWSNGDGTCKAQSTASDLSPAFSVSSNVNPGAVTLDPSDSVNDSSYTSTTWNFGDGTANFSTGGPVAISHTYASGTYTVTMTVVDQYGNVATVSHTLTVGSGPVAAFSASATHLIPGNAATFSSSSTDSNASITGDRWTFGDGSPDGSGASAQHAYSTSGQRYPVTLTVTDANGATASVTHMVTVGYPPSAAFSVPTPSPLAGSPVDFDGAGSGENQGTISAYSWSFGDGGTGSGSSPHHTYSQPGSYTVSLTVTDAYGYTDTTTHQVTVSGSPSAVFSPSSARSVVGATVSFDGSASAEAYGAIASYAWSFGDGSYAGGVTVRHAYTRPGNYAVSLTVTDADGRTASTSSSLSVVPAPAPSAVLSVLTTPTVAQVPASFSGADSSDPGAAIVAYSWSFGDGSTAAGVTPLHTYAKPGRYTVVLTVQDSAGLHARTAAMVSVARPAITGIKIVTGKKIEQVRFALDGPGTLVVAAHRHKIAHPEIYTYRLKLSPVQRAALKHHHRLHFKVVAKFLAAGGSDSRRLVSFTVRQ